MQNNNLMRLVLTLTIIGLFSAFALAYVYEWTTPMINKHDEMAKKEAIYSVLPDVDDVKQVKKGDLTFYEGYSNGSMVGIALETSGGGFQGIITLMLGADPVSGKIYGIKVLNHQETPGLGANITGEDFEKNFRDKPFGEYSVVKRPVSNPYEVEAISGATISSQKVTNIVEKAVKDIKRYYGGGSE
ncbi:RnfABCDGE type electron transport complex subunit G [Halothermothrix orenii]|uniref:Ion-translocating oxidoreductase complex subunit G n=1 Tax=Halothermothrix orenii (strain H 168 / OCM 544 / DSM 9562) TaxID=373903 RepID=B8CY13_HALOH|nr:RnfABCDGE type electron transport complex subunit G [Halothermothrix orenii]ACL70182.1 electron transport complex, RnfABCDGE type, G subunit [Halothermothrix orenii H 168]